MENEAGYITLACGSDKYLQMAINLALSIKLNDRTKPVCLVHDEAIRPTPALERAFDCFVLLPGRAGYAGCMNKIRLHESSPFGATMYVDADCIIVKNDMARHWARLAGNHFNLQGTKRTTGRWYNFEIEEACKKLGIPHIVEMNSGIFYFERGTEANGFFDLVNRLYREKRDILGCVHQQRVEQLADEPFLGAAMAMERIEPVDATREEAPIMITTLRARGSRFDPFQHVSAIEKGFGVLVPRTLASTWIRYSPSIAHFVALRPRALYNKIANDLRLEFGFPPYAPTS